MKPLAALLLPLALAACEQPAAEPAANTTEAAAPNAYHERLKAMQEPLRNATFMRAVIDSKHSCRRVTRSEYRGRHQNLEMWTAQCENAGKWGVFIGSDSSVQIRACEELTQLGLPPCEGPMPQQSLQAAPADADKGEGS